MANNLIMNWTLVDKNVESISHSMKQFLERMHLDINVSEHEMSDLLPANDSVFPAIWSMNFTTAVSRMMNGLEVKDNIKVCILFQDL